MFVASDFVSNILTRAHSISKECYNKVQSIFASRVFSGSHWVSPPGEPDAHYLSIASSCKNILQDTNLPMPAHNFFGNIRETAIQYNEDKLIRDRLEEEEEEI